MASFVFTKAKAKFAAGEINWVNDPIMAIAVNAIPARSTPEFVSDIIATEIGPAGARATLAGKAINEDAVDHEAELDANDFTHTAVASGDTAVGTILYKQVGGDDTTPADDPVIAFLDYTDIPTNGGDIEVTLAAEGALKF